MEPLHDYFDLRSRIHGASPEIRDLWSKTALKRRFAGMFVRMREVAGAPQTRIVERTGWDKAFVSRLEGAQGGVPDINTIARFADACGLTVGLVVCQTSPAGGAGRLRVIDAFSLHPDQPESETAVRDDREYLSSQFQALIGDDLPAAEPPTRSAV
jgi:transcriptional regulator with XRE-family HTH domain